LQRILRSLKVASSARSELCGTAGKKAENAGRCMAWHAKRHLEESFLPEWIRWFVVDPECRWPWANPFGHPY